MFTGLWSDSLLVAAAVLIPVIGMGLIGCLVDLVHDLRRESTPQKPVGKADFHS